MVLMEIEDLLRLEKTCHRESGQFHRFGLN